MKYYIKKYSYETIGAIVCLALGLLSGYSVSSSHSDWYQNLIKPSFNSPSWIFGPVWIILYIQMGIALGKIWRNKYNNKTSITAFIIQFIFNLLWSPLFFIFIVLI